MPEPETIEAEVAEQLQNLPAIRRHEAVVARDELSVEDVVAQHDKIIAVMQAVMKDGVHYGVIPGVSKPSLLKPGAEAINVALRLAPDYESDKLFSDDGHLTVTAKCTLRHITTGLVIAAGEGLCSTRETKYAYRKAERVCPACGAAAIIKGKAEYGGGWVCWKKRDGCGAQFPDGDPAIESQTTERVDNPDLADTWNTVLKMADKRALIAAVLNGTAASDVFTQDVEDKVVDSPVARDEYGYVKRENKPLDIPKTWTGIEGMIGAYDATTWDAFRIFAEQASAYLFGATPGNLNSEQKRELREAGGRAAVALRAKVDPGSFPPPTRDQMAQAWSEALQMEKSLAGPPWRMSPDEDREPREES